ncbi:hypothetical protein VB618_05725 [Microvirga sp. CF3062]|uniref:hypothetical protein n=1 Tax=Microvirga sp. CF3062 TaxID=3110182 RepID=UPI002E7773F5|nr:hypothetical protein [Microvirga sp. CF3062]MEE1655688.1 hypothetical protein [Microvirga sp. CF3062]
MSHNTNIVAFQSRRRGKFGQSSYTSFFFECLRYTLVKHMQSRRRGYQTILTLMLSEERQARYNYSTEISDKWRWEYLRDIVKKGLFLSDEMMRPLISYILEEEPESQLHFNQSAYIERVGGKLADFFLLPALKETGYDQARLRQVADIEGFYAAFNGPFPGPVLPENWTLILSIKWAEGTPFLVITSFCVEPDETGNLEARSSSKFGIAQGVGVVAAEFEVFAFARDQIYHRPFFLRFYTENLHKKNRFAPVEYQPLIAGDICVDRSYLRPTRSLQVHGRDRIVLSRIPDEYTPYVKELIDTLSWSV